MNRIENFSILKLENQTKPKRGPKPNRTENIGLIWFNQKPKKNENQKILKYKINSSILFLKLKLNQTKLIKSNQNEQKKIDFL